MTNGGRKEHSQTAVEILAKFRPDNITDGVVPDVHLAATLAVAHALLAVNSQLAHVANEISLARLSLQAIASPPRNR